MDYYRADVSDIAPQAPAGASPGAQASPGEHPSAYRPDAMLVDAVNVALVLNRPLLVTGEPGTGKTQLAYSIAWQLAARRLLDVTSPAVEKFETKSTTVARDLFYSFDVLGRFHASREGSKDNVDYMTFNALGRALLDSIPAEEARRLVPRGHTHVGPRRSVVLVDEVDKAPRDFPNDLLNELDEMYFRIPELGNVVVGGRGPLAERYRPVVVITSNSEKTLPDPFLRRCIYYDIPFPTREGLEEILLARLRHLDVTRGPLLDTALEFFVHLRERRVARRKISPAELMQWITVMLRRGARPDQRLRDVKEQALAGLPALTKYPDDQKIVREELGRFVAEG